MRTRRPLYVTPGDSHEGCDGCSRTTRRQFLGQVSSAAITAALASEFALASAAALPVTEATGASAQADERTYPLPAADGVTIDRDAQIILVRHQNRVFAFGLACPHENTALRWRQQDSRFQCPRHESKYQPDGTFISGRATRNMMTRIGTEAPARPAGGIAHGMRVSRPVVTATASPIPSDITTRVLTPMCDPDWRIMSARRLPQRI